MHHRLPGSGISNESPLKVEMNDEDLIFLRVIILRVAAQVLQPQTPRGHLTQNRPGTPVYLGEDMIRV